MIKNIKLYKLSQDGNFSILKIKTTTKTFIFFKYIEEKYLNKKEYCDLCIEDNNKRKVSGDKIYFQIKLLKSGKYKKIESYELVFLSNIEEMINNYFLLIKKELIDKMYQYKNYYNEQYFEVINSKIMYDEINKLEKEFRHIKLEEVII